MWDVWMGGPATILSQLKPRGVCVQIAKEVIKAAMPKGSED